MGLNLPFYRIVIYLVTYKPVYRRRCFRGGRCGRQRRRRRQANSYDDQRSAAGRSEARLQRQRQTGSTGARETERRDRARHAGGPGVVSEPASQGEATDQGRQTSLLRNSQLDSVLVTTVASLSEYRQLLF